MCEETREARFIVERLLDVVRDCATNDIVKRVIVKRAEKWLASERAGGGRQE